MELGFPLTSLAKEAHGLISANLNLFNKPAPENAESSPAEPAQSEGDAPEEVQEGTAAPEEDAAAEEEEIPVEATKKLSSLLRGPQEEGVQKKVVVCQ